MTALVTGTPVGVGTSSESIYLESAPTIWFQDYTATPLHNPDSDGFYYGLSGTAAYPYYELGCVTAVSFVDNVTTNDVLCDNVGVVSTVEQRNYVEYQFTLQSFFPFSVLRHMMKGGTVTTNAGTGHDKFGLGPIDNNRYWMVWSPKVYDEDAGDYIAIHLHKAKLVNAFSITMPFGSTWQLTGVVFRAMADTSKPVAQRFATIIRYDPSVL